MAVTGDSLIQWATGSSGATDVASLSIGLSTPPLSDSTIIIIIANRLTGLGQSIWADPWTAQHGTATAFQTVAPWGDVFARASTGASSWIFAVDNGAPTTWAWMAMEWTGVVNDYQAARPQPILDGWMDAIDVGGTATTIETGVDTNTSGEHGPRLVLAANLAKTTGGTTPPSVSSWDDTVPQEGDWVRIGTHVASSTASVNIGLDVAYKVINTGDDIDVTATYPAPAAALTAAHMAWEASFVPPLRTDFRPAIPSLMP